MKNKGYGFVLTAISVALTIYCVSKLGIAIPSEGKAATEVFSIPAQVLATMVGLVFTVLTLVLNLRAFPIRVLVPRILASEEIAVFSCSFALTLILDVIGLTTRTGKFYAVISDGFFTATLVLLLNAVYFVLMQLKLEEPLDALAQEFSDSIG